ncbi:MAG: site-specific DNA-methyltransferase [Hyphomicrobium sp.]
MSNRLREKDLLVEIDRLKELLAEAQSSRPYGLVWEDKPEQFDADADNAVPVLETKGGKFKDVILDPDSDHNVLIEGDNYHALSVLSFTHKGKIDLIYADPPYNTGNNSWRYNNDYVDKDDIYRHSKWLSFMQRRLTLAHQLLADTGVFVLTIDDYEIFDVGMLLDKIFGEQNRIGIVAIEVNPRGRTTNQFFATSHEYILFYAKDAAKAVVDFRDLTEEQAGAFDLEDETSRYRLLPFRRSGGLSTREERPNSFYPIYFHQKTGRIDIKPFTGAAAILPIDGDGRERVWRQTKPSLAAAIERGDMIVKPGRRGFTVLMKDRIKDGRKPKTIWVDPQYDASTHGTVLLQQIFNGKRKLFDYPKSLPAVVDTIELLIGSNPNAIVLDFFAGSGTTGHAVLQLNKRDGAERRFILCTNNENNICEDVTFERIKRVMKGYTTPKGEKIAGLGGNLTYLKTAFVKKELKVGLSDEAKLELTRRANLILSLRENTFTPVAATDHYEITQSPYRLTGVYFSENKSELIALLDRLKAMAGEKIVTVYVFAWEKGAYKKGVSGYDFTFEDIPEPLVEVYQAIGL